MIRKFNYTGRRKLKRSNIDIRLQEEARQRSFYAYIEFEGLNLPADAIVYIEPYFQLYSMRFKCGTVENYKLPENTVLSEMPYSDLVYFRVKIVDESGKIGGLIAYADQLKPKRFEESNNRKPLLPVEFNLDLGQQIWKLSFTSSPILQINKRIENRKNLVRTEEFISLVYPSIIREVMTKIIRDYSDYNEEGDHWSNDWLQFSKRVLNVYNILESEEKDEEEIAEWIDNIVESFCRKNGILNRFKITNLAK